MENPFLERLYLGLENRSTRHHRMVPLHPLAWSLNTNPTPRTPLCIASETQKA